MAVCCALTILSVLHVDRQAYGHYESIGITGYVDGGDADADTATRMVEASRAEAQRAALVEASAADAWRAEEDHVACLLCGLAPALLESAGPAGFSLSVGTDGSHLGRTVSGRYQEAGGDTVHNGWLVHAQWESRPMAPVKRQSCFSN